MVCWFWDDLGDIVGVSELCVFVGRSFFFFVGGGGGEGLENLSCCFFVYVGVW